MSRLEELVVAVEIAAALVATWAPVGERYWLLGFWVGSRLVERPRASWGCA